MKILGTEPRLVGGDGATSISSVGNIIPGESGTPRRTIITGDGNIGQQPPEPCFGAAQKAMEAAAQKERIRAKEMEKLEENVSIDDLKRILKRERIRMSRMAADLAAMKVSTVQSVAEAEVNEEGRINCLMRRLEGVKQERGRVILDLEREEDMLTNNLQEKLDHVRREKTMLERKVEKEQSSHSKLKSKLMDLTKNNSQRSLDASITQILEEEEENEEETENEEITTERTAK